MIRPRHRARANTPRSKVPYRVWVASWGWRDSDVVQTVAVDGELSKKQARELIEQIIGEWIDYEEQQLVEGEEVDAVVYGPFLESYIKTVKDLPRDERPHVERDIRHAGWAYIS